MLKSTYGHVLVLPSQRLVRPVADDNFVHSVHWGINPPPPFLGNPAPSILVFHELPPSPPLKVRFFSEPPKY